MFKYRRFLFVALFSILTAACGGDTEVRLTADKKEITAGGIDFATIVATAILDGDPASGMNISFSTTLGSFSPNTESDSQEVSTEANGTATIKLYSSKQQGNATVTAEFYDDTTDLSGTGSITITFGPPTLDQLPVNGEFRLNCDADNIGALRRPAPDLKVKCELRAQTRDGKAIPASALNAEFRMEAGSISPITDSYSEDLIFMYTPKGGISAPKDVPPDPTIGEPSYQDTNGLQRNPRDGLVTIIAVVDGEESFTDTNGNGSFDEGEPFVDSAEPFVDANDNDAWDADEEYIDTNGNGQWDRVNGYWDQKIKIMAIHKILWTGKLHSSTQTSRIDAGSGLTSIMDSGKLELKAYALDINMNPIAGFNDNGDYLEWSLSSNGDASSISPTEDNLDNILGFDFDIQANTERQRWMIKPNTFLKEPTSHFTVEDGYPGDEEPTAASFTVAVRVHASPGPSDVDEYLPQITDDFAERVDGTCN